MHKEWAPPHASLCRHLFFILHVLLSCQDLFSFDFPYPHLGGKFHLKVAGGCKHPNQLSVAALKWYSQKMAPLPLKSLSLLTKLSYLFMNSLDVDNIFQASFVMIWLKGKQKWSSYSGHELLGSHCWNEPGMPWDFSSRCWAPSLSTCHKLSLEQPSQLFKAFHRARLQGPILASLAIPFQHKMEGPAQYLA